MNRRKILFAGAALIIIFMLLLVAWLSLSGAGKPEAGKEPSKEVLDVVRAYVQAQQNSVGADQVSPNSWVNQVKSLTTDSWFKTLTPSTSPSTGETPYNYTYAHQNNYTVKAALSGCLWDSTLSPPNRQAGLVDCRLEDQTIDRDTGQTVPASELPFSWTAVGEQMDPRISVVKRDGKWLVNGDLTGQAQ
jgi:hypothetical protein